MLHQPKSTFFLLLIILILGVPRVTNGDSLYSEEDSNVVNLDVSNFTQTIVNSNHSWIVEYYATWCGHCQRLAPVWKAFASDIKDWSTVIKVAAIPCSDESNTPVCREYNVWGYPTVRFMPPYSSAGYDGEPYRGRGTVEEFREATIDFLEGLRLKPHHWPTLQNMNSLEAYNEPASQGKLVFVLFEDIADAEYEPYTGREVIMDFSGQQILATIVRMDKMAADKLNIGGLPVLFRLMPNMRLHKIADKQDREGFRTAIKQTMQEHAIAVVSVSTVVPSTTPEVTTKTSGSTTRMWMPTVGVHMQDLEAGLYYSLWIEVGSHRNIGGQAMTALKEYVHMLAEYFPGSPNVKLFLQKADSWLQLRRGSTSGALWRRKFERIKSENAYIPSAMRWRSCTGSQPHFRGYPCALWTIFHTLTVAAYDKHVGDEEYDPQEVLFTIQDYVQNFMGCRDCAEHFVQMAASVTNVTDSEDVVLWLWQAHNNANKRLAGDVTEDPRHLKVQFPTMWMCPTCRSGIDPNTQEIIWNESEVLEFLRRFYGEHYIIQTPWTPQSTLSTIKPGPNDSLDAAPTGHPRPPKLRTAPPPVTLQRLSAEERQDSVLAFHGPDTREYNKGPNRLSEDGQSDSTTPRWVAPLDQRGHRNTDRIGTNPFNPDFPQRGRYFDPHANKHSDQNRRDHSNRNDTSASTSTKTSLRSTPQTTTVETMPLLTATISLSESYRESQRQNTIHKTIPTRSTLTDVDSIHHPQLHTTGRPIHNQYPPTRRSYAQYPNVPTTSRPNYAQYPHRQTQQRNNYPQPQPTQRPYFQQPQPTQRPYYQQPQPTQRPYYQQPQPTQRPYYQQPQPTQRPYFQPQPTQRPYYHQPQPTQRPYYRNFNTPQETPRPHSRHFIHHEDGLISHVYNHNNKLSKPGSTAIGRPRNCTLQSTTWSQCSKSCGTGMSTRFSNDNPRCRMEMEMRICKLRPCNMAFREHVRPGSCGATFRAVWEETIEYGSCSSVVSRKWHYCGSCPGMCCRPVVEDTNWMTFVCKNGEMTHSKFMRIKLCRCLPGRC